MIKNEGGRTMSTVGALNAAVQGIQAAEKKAARAATDIATMSAKPEETRLVQDIVELKAAQAAQKANVNAFKKADEMEKQLIDVIA